MKVTRRKMIKQFFAGIVYALLGIAGIGGSGFKYGKHSAGIDYIEMKDVELDLFAEDFTIPVDFKLDDGNWHYVLINRFPRDDGGFAEKICVDGKLVTSFVYPDVDNYEFTRSRWTLGYNVKHLNYNMTFVKSEKFWCRREDADSISKSS